MARSAVEFILDENLPPSLIEQALIFATKGRGYSNQRPAGWKWIGSGYCSDAFSAGKSLVVKFNHHRSWREDSQAPWLKWCAENQHNKHVPRIHYLYIHKDGKRFVCIMERLEKYHPDKFSKVLFKKANMEKFQYWSIGAFMEDVVISGLNKFKKKSRREYTAEYFLREKEFKSLLETLDSMHLLYKKIEKKDADVSVDIHNENYMVRVNGKKLQLVITDPFVACT